jgi:hypothetical protein
MDADEQLMMPQTMQRPWALRQKLPMRLNARLNMQRGVSLVGLIFVLAMLGLVLLLGLKVIPTYIEYRAISTAIVSAKAGASTVAEARSAFDRSASATYIDSVSGRDLDIVNDGGVIEISFAYEKKIPLIGPASLVLDYAGSTTKGAVAVSAPAETTTRQNKQ